MIRNKTSSSGQILAIGAISISILLLGIALNLNTALHSNYSAIESLDTTEQSGEQYITEHEQIVQSHHTKLAKDSSLSYTDLRNRYQSMLNKSTTSISKQYISKGINIDAGYDSAENGFILYQLNQNSVTNKNGTDNWTLIDSVGEYNKFKFIADIDSLTGTSNPNQSNAFHLKIMNNGSVEHRIYFYKNSGDGVVETRDSAGSTQYTCTFSNLNNSSINIHAQTVNSNGCQGFSVIESGDTIQIQNGNLLQSKFIFKGKGDMSTKTSATDYNSDSSSDYPQRTRILYSVTNTITYTDTNTQINQQKTITIGDIYDI